MHRIVAKKSSRKLGFQQEAFSETRGYEKGRG
jgi:hypothetical protein